MKKKKLFIKITKLKIIIYFKKNKKPISFQFNRSLLKNKHKSILFSNNISEIFYIIWLFKTFGF